jgi:hypothetical protein
MLVTWQGRHRPTLEQAMLRFTIAILVAMAATGSANSSDKPLAHRSWHRAVKLPVGLPRPHYDFRTTISYRAPILSPRPYFTPAYAEVPYIPLRTGTPLLPGSSTLPGYYGSPNSYDYQGPYYGGPYVGYWDRLPYACGVYGYC